MTSRVILAVLCLAAAAALLVLGVPRLAVSLSALPGDITYRRILAKEPVRQAEVRRLLVGREQLAARYGSPEATADAAYLALVLSLRSQDSDRRSGYRLRAIGHYEHGLRRRPLDAKAWLRLAELRLRHEGVFSDSFRHALLASMAAGPYERHLLWSRLELLLSTRILPKDLSWTLAHQAQAAWQIRHRRLAFLSARYGREDDVLPLVAINVEEGRRFREDVSWARAALRGKATIDW